MPSDRRALLAALVVAVLTVVMSVPGAARVGDAVAAESLDQLKIVFTALPRSSDGTVSGLQQIYTADAGGAITRITSDDGYFYDWAAWAFNGTKIVYTARRGETPGVEEDLWLMDPDGSHRRQLTTNAWRNAQPKVSPDGRSVVFASIWSESPQLAIFRLDLRTLQVENLTARGAGKFSFESDPNYSADGNTVVFAYSGGRASETATIATQIWSMNADGTNAKAITHDGYYNTDPMLSPDGRSVVISSYRGSGVPKHAWPPQSQGDIFLQDWHLVVRDLASGSERVLTRGQRCAAYPAACGAADGPAWVPKWSPGGTMIGYLTLRSPVDSGIAVMNADGTNARPLIERRGLSINWWDWTDGRQTAADGAADQIGSAVPGTRILYTASVYDDLAQGEDPPAARLFAASSDRWLATEVRPERRDLVPLKARWSPDKRQILFTARVPVDRAHPRPEPAPPSGESRRPHFTFADLDILAASIEAPRTTGDVAEEQVFLMNADGSGVRQLTTPWTEDYLDAVPTGDARGNTDPDMSPDGRYVLVTNLSTLTNESSILRIDLQTGEVISLTNVTAGAVPVADAGARFSPDGTRIAFSSSFVGGSQIYTMALDGTDVRTVTDDDYANLDPSWSPDGRELLYSSYRGTSSIVAADDPQPAELPLKDWYAVTTDLDGGASAVVAGSDRLVLRPTWSPDGRSIAFISTSPDGQPDIYVVGRDGRGLRPLQVTIKSKESFFDWR